MAFPGPVAVDASAARDAGRLGAIPDLRQGEVRDSPWASDHDFPSAMAGKERLVLPEHQDDRERHLARQLRDASPKAAHRQVLQVAEAQQIVPRRALLALPQADESELPRADESELPRAQSLRAQQASRPVVPQPVQELVPCVTQEQPLRALPLQLASPRVLREPQARSVSQPLAPRSLAVARRAQQVSSARPSQPLLSLLSPLWQPLLLVLPLRRLPESFCALSQRRPQGSSSSASSFPSRHSRATGQ